MTEVIAVAEAEAVEKATQMPAPKGYKILCMVPQAEQRYENGLLKADTTITTEEHSTLILFVVKLGDMAYMDKDKFPTGPWCQEGDFVMVRAYSGTRFKIHGQEFRIINDDTVDAVTQDPRGITRA